LTNEWSLFVTTESEYRPPTHAPPSSRSEPPKKRIGNDAGFRGIGRLAGLAYCDKLVFTTAAKDEPWQTELAFDAAAIRQDIAPASSTGESETAAELLTRLTTHRQRNRTPGAPFFEVKLVGVDPTACPFLDVDQVRTYLRQVAPVEFNMQAFVYGNGKINPFLETHNARRTINLTLMQNGRQDKINKPYKTYHEAGNRTSKRVEITDIETCVDTAPMRTMKPGAKPSGGSWSGQRRSSGECIRTLVSGIGR
jgi:hypothetical protein